MDKIRGWWARRRPTKRRLIQLYAALLYNAHLKGFIKGEIFTGASKNFCVPGFNCYSCPGAIGACPLGALQNALAVSEKRAPFYVLGILALFGLIFGRTICGWLCPVGLIQELLHKIPTPKLKKGRLTRIFSYLKYLVLAYFVIAIPLLRIGDGVPVPGFCKYVCPVGTLEGAVGLLSNRANEKLLSALGILFTRKFIIMTAIFTLSIFVYRLFCRFLCPLGAIYSLFSRFALLGVKVDAQKCTGCGLCVASCEMDIRRVGDRECIQCGRCMRVCPSKAISWKNGRVRVAENAADEAPSEKKNRNVAIAVFAVLALAAALWYGNFSEDAISVPIAAKLIAEDGRAVGSEVGMRCPDFEISLCGEKGNVTLADCLGRPTVINFWATWCGGCCKELPDFQRFYDDYGDRVNLFAVHSVEVTDDVDAFIADHGYSFRFAVDENNAMIPALGGTTALPQTVILDKNGTIVYNRIASVNYALLEAVVKPLLEETAEAALTEEPVAAPISPEKPASVTAEESESAAGSAEEPVAAAASSEKSAPVSSEEPVAAPISAEESVVEASDGLSDYLITLTDQNGEGVAGAMLQVCTDLNCQLFPTDSEGKVTFRDQPYPYEVHILMLPAGYTGDTAEAYTLKAEGGSLEIHVEKQA